MPENMDWLTPVTAKTIAMAPNVDIWKRCIAIASVARVYSTPRIRNNCKNIANHSTPTALWPTGLRPVRYFGSSTIKRMLTLCSGYGLCHESYKPSQLEDKNCNEARQHVRDIRRYSL